MRMKALAVAACATLAVSALAACGDDDDDTPATTVGGATVTTVVGDVTIPASVPMDTTMTTTS